MQSGVRFFAHGCHGLTPPCGGDVPERAGGLDPGVVGMDADVAQKVIIKLAKAVSAAPQGDQADPVAQGRQAAHLACKGGERGGRGGHGRPFHTV